MSVWSVVLTVYMACCISVVTSQLVQHELSVSLTASSLHATYNFDGHMFNRFYQCLFNKDYNIICDALKNNQEDVIQVRGCSQEEDGTQSVDRFTCGPKAAALICKRGDSLPGSNETGCLRNYNTDPGALLSQQVQMTWVDAENVEMSSNKLGIMKSNSQDNTFVIKESNDPAMVTIMTPIPSDLSTATAASSTDSPGTDKLKSDDEDDDNNNLAIIIGAATGGFVVIVIIVIIFWRCKRKTSSSLASNNKECEDTDIYPYGVSTLSNIEQNLNSNSLNTNPNTKEPTPDMYAAVDSNKKPKKTKTSSDTNNADKNNENKSQQEKPRFNQSLDYTEVDIDNDAGHYQSSADVHNDQGVASRVTISPSAPPIPSAKPSYYNISSEAGKDPSATYSQVIKTNKTKDASTINGNGTGSNPTRDPNGYEEAVPRIDTQYTTVDPSENNTTIPAPDGVYAKLHDPVRNITDVYNEWPATDNAEK